MMEIAVVVMESVAGGGEEGSRGGVPSSVVQSASLNFFAPPTYQSPYSFCSQFDKRKQKGYEELRINKEEKYEKI
jgi:hypothetical protein